MERKPLRVVVSKGHSLSEERGVRDKSEQGQKGASEGHSHPRECRARHKSGHEKKAIDRPRGTHILESAERGTNQDTERKWVNEGHSRAGE
jgi:hypothetical protein